MRTFEYCVFIGLFQPFALAQAEILKEALNQADTVLVVLGGSKNASNIKYPWTADQRRKMIADSLSLTDLSRVTFIEMRDYLYNDNLWLSVLQQKVDEITGDSTNVALIGHESGRGIHYLNQFPQWKRIDIKNLDKFPRATDICQQYFTLDSSYKTLVPDGTAKLMEEFKNTDKFKDLKADYDYLREYRMSWEGAPFPVTFVTVDAVVIKSGHVLTVRRKGNPGKGLIALPGGFLNQNERVLDGMLRELREETVIKMSKEDLEKAIKDSRVFDHPDRSLRGRTITHAFLINLGAGVLPQVKGSDDADKAWWMPLSESHDREDEFFEDHYHIISYFMNRY